MLGPSDELGQWRDRPRGHDVEEAPLVLSASADHVDPAGQPQLLDYLGEERGAPQQGLEQHHRKVETGDREGNAWQSGTVPNIDDTGPPTHQLRECRAVEHVSLPEPVRLAWPDQSPVNSSTCQYIDISRYQLRTARRTPAPRRQRRTLFSRPCE